jgi:prophage DNA circulation protein
MSFVDFSEVSKIVASAFHDAKEATHAFNVKEVEFKEANAKWLTSEDDLKKVSASILSLKDTIALLEKQEVSLKLEAQRLMDAQSQAFREKHEARELSEQLMIKAKSLGDSMDLMLKADKAFQSAMKH